MGLSDSLLACHWPLATLRNTDRIIRAHRGRVGRLARILRRLACSGRSGRPPGSFADSSSPQRSSTRCLAGLSPAGRGDSAGSAHRHRWPRRDLVDLLPSQAKSPGIGVAFRRSSRSDATAAGAHYGGFKSSRTSLRQRRRRTPDFAAKTVVRVAPPVAVVAERGGQMCRPKVSVGVCSVRGWNSLILLR